MSKCVLTFQDYPISPSSRGSDPTQKLVRIYGTAKGIEGVGHIGNLVRDQVERLGVSTSTQAFDLLTISMAVTAADSFFQRGRFSQNNWARDFELNIPVVRPGEWSAVSSHLEQTLEFLTGDAWKLNFLRGGPSKPNAVNGRLRKKLDLTGSDCVSLYSGGLDSWLGVKNFLKQSKKPVLISHAYPKDAERQKFLYSRLGTQLPWFRANASPYQYGGGNDTSMRGRSFNFLAMAAVAADAISQLRNLKVVPLYIPENGFIALNAPLTPRRVGSHSTRTAHPEYLTMMQKLFNDVGIAASIENPFKASTKGEMLRAAKLSNQEQQDAIHTVSCGKWKRKNEQCGRCVPCLIRRASFHAAGVNDTTPYTYGILQNFNDPIGKNKDDLMAVLRAARPTNSSDLRKRAMKSGSLPADRGQFQSWLSVHERGLDELGNFLTAKGLKV